VVHVLGQRELGGRQRLHRTSDIGMLGAANLDEAA